MKYKSALVTAASGKVNGLVASHNKGGQYFRSLKIPTNPGSPLQAALRGYFAQLVNAWNNILTSAQRTDWNTYAANTNFVDTLGNTIKLSGQQCYIRGNTSRLQASMTRIDAGPTIFDTGDYTIPAITSITASTGILLLAFTNTDAWAAAANNAMLVYVSRPQNPSISYFKGPYRFAGKIVGAATPPTSPASITCPFTVAVGQRVFIKVEVTRSDGRLSHTFLNFGTGV